MQGGTKQRHPFNLCGHCTFNHTEANEFQFVQNDSVTFLITALLCHTLKDTKDTGKDIHRPNHPSNMYRSPEAQLKHPYRCICYMSHRCMSRILIFISGRRGNLPGELAEAGSPRPRPRQALRWTWGQSIEAAREGKALALVLGEEALDELQFFLLFPQEDVDQELLLLFKLLHDGFGNVRDHPGNYEAEEHHQILEEGVKRRKRCVGGKDGWIWREMDDKSNVTKRLQGI